MGCEFPDAYVDPYPEFYRAIDRLALRGKVIARDLQSQKAARIGEYFEKLHQAMVTLGGMAEKERKKTKDELAFINEAVVTRSVGCGDQQADGWYPSLFFEKKSATEFDPTIADVHTQPTDEHGNMVGNVLHIATGQPRFMTVAVDTCHGPKVFTGVVSSYHEKTTKSFERLTDQQWATELYNNKGGQPADVSWLTDLVVRP